MTTFEKVISALGQSASALAASAILSDMPKWVAVSSIVLGAFCSALSPKLISVRRTSHDVSPEPAAPGKDDDVR